MFNVSGPEFLIVLVVALIVLGPDKLPDALRKAGRLFAEIRRITSGLQDELRDALNEATAIPSTPDEPAATQPEPERPAEPAPTPDPAPVSEAVLPAEPEPAPVSEAVLPAEPEPALNGDTAASPPEPGPGGEVGASAPERFPEPEPASPAGVATPADDESSD